MAGRLGRADAKTAELSQRGIDKLAMRTKRIDAELMAGEARFKAALTKSTKRTASKVRF